MPRPKKDAEIEAVVAEMKNLREEIHQLKSAVLTLAQVQLGPRLQGTRVSPHDEIYRWYREFVAESD